MKKQVILLMTDTQRKDMIGAYGNKDMITPNLDNLCKNGIRFENAFCTQPVCTPSRSALFSGLYPHTNGCIANSIAYGDNVRTIGKRLSDKGISCGYIGKYHLDGGDYFGLGKAPDGFLDKYWYDMKNYLDELPQEDRLKSRQIPSSFSEDIDDSFTFADRCSNRAIDFLDEYKNDDFFLTVSYDEPHHPYVAPKKFLDLYKDYQFPKSENVFDDLKNKPEHHRVWRDSLNNRDPKNFDMSFTDYFGCNSFVDFEIGRVIKEILRQCPEALIIYTSDHGCMLNSHGLVDKGCCMYNEITNIPFIVYHKDFEQNKINTTPISHVDFTPTIMEYFCIDIPPCIEGESVLNIFANNTTLPNRDIFMEFTRYEADHDGFMAYQPIRSIFDGRYKLVINLMCQDELYDLELDRQEMNNLIESKSHTTIRNELFTRLINKMNYTRDSFRGYYWEERSWHKTTNKSFGYTGYTRQREDLDYEDKQLDYNTGLPITNLVRPK